MKAMELSLELVIRNLRVDCNDVLYSLKPDNAGMIDGECMENNSLKFTVTRIKPSSIYSLTEELVMSIDEVEKMGEGYS